MYNAIDVDAPLRKEDIKKSTEAIKESAEVLKMRLTNAAPIAKELEIEKKEIELGIDDTARESRDKIEKELGEDFLSVIKGINKAVNAVPKIGVSDTFVQLVIQHGGVWIFSKTLLDVCIFLCPYAKTEEEKVLLEETIDFLMTMYLKKAKEAIEKNNKEA